MYVLQTFLYICIFKKNNVLVTIYQFNSVAQTSALRVEERRVGAAKWPQRKGSAFYSLHPHLPLLLRKRDESV